MNDFSPKLYPLLLVVVHLCESSQHNMSGLIGATKSSSPWLELVRSIRSFNIVREGRDTGCGGSAQSHTFVEGTQNCSVHICVVFFSDSVDNSILCAIGVWWFVRAFLHPRMSCNHFQVDIFMAVFIVALFLVNWLDIRCCSALTIIFIILWPYCLKGECHSHYAYINISKIANLLQNDTYMYLSFNNNNVCVEQI